MGWYCSLLVWLLFPSVQYSFPKVDTTSRIEHVTFRLPVLSYCGYATGNDHLFIPRSRAVSAISRLWEGVFGKRTFTGMVFYLIRLIFGCARGERKTLSHKTKTPVFPDSYSATNVILSRVDFMLSLGDESNKLYHGDEQMQMFLRLGKYEDISVSSVFRFRCHSTTIQHTFGSQYWQVHKTHHERLACEIKFDLMRIIGE